MSTIASTIALIHKTVSTIKFLFENISNKNISLDKNASKTRISDILGIFAEIVPGPEDSNGTYVDITEHPYLVSITIPKIKICTGTIINEFFIVTSAYCVAQAPDLKSIKIRAGSTARNNGGVALRPLKVIIHPLFENKWGSDFNLAIIILPVPITFTGVIQPIKLPEECENFDDKMVLAGWGPMRGSSGYSTELKQYKQVKRDRPTCDTIYPKLSTARTFCGASIPMEQVCKGHGMPVIAQNKLVGIYGWRSNCYSQYLPEIYSKICAYRSWIRAETGI